MSKILTPHFNLEDLKNLSLDELPLLATEIKERILDVMSRNGGHLASNLGAIELTLALHRVFNSPEDPFIFDVSHQAYTHKILTGRNARFETIRQTDGLSGFTHPPESPHDHFYAGHAGAALSTAMGAAMRRDLTGGDEMIIPILGDASLTCGLTLEALNNLPRELKNFIVILNDNAMSISKNVGAITHILSRLINNPTANRLYNDISLILKKIPSIGDGLSKQGGRIKESIKNLVSDAPFFEQFNLQYVGPIDGHDLPSLITTFEALKNSTRPTLVHLITRKGNGMEVAAQNPTTYHGAKPFNRETGKFLPTKQTQPTFPKVFGKHILQLADKRKDVVAVTPAMPAGSCLTEMMAKYPMRCLDVGIAEGHAVTFSGGLAHNKKLKVITSIYSTFLQRAMDNLFHDVCLQNSPVIFAIDRAGIAGGDGITHNGIYDIGFLNAMPNMIISVPRNGDLLKDLLESALDWDQPCAIRYPNLPTIDSQFPAQVRPLGKGELLRRGKSLALIALGHMCDNALEVANNLQAEGIEATVVDPIFIKPLDQELMHELFQSHEHIVTLEEHSIKSGLGAIINSFATTHRYANAPINFGVPDQFIEHGKHADLQKRLGLDAASITDRLLTQYLLKEVPL